MAPLILYDIPGRDGKCWSPNPWKPRMVLNYKGINYKTEFIEYPDIASRFKELGIPPNDKNDPGYYIDYTSPAARFDDGTLIMDSWKIAHELEKRYPTPSLHLDHPIVTQVKDAMNKLFGAIQADVLPKVPRNILRPVSAEYFERTRAEWAGKSLSQVEKEHGEKAWEKVVEPAKEVADLLRKNGGPFFLGDKVSYADFIIVSFLEFLHRAEPQLQERFLKLDPAYGKVLEASREWLKKDD